MLLLWMPTSRIGVLVCVPTAVFLIPLSANISLEAAGDGSSGWVPATHMGNSDAISGSWVYVVQPWLSQAFG
ncbi:hypothetical protein, partial [Borreliella garinii]|uniref:hypothetical protein n=1 Tax=Borreliella garinii TaxID=29519 RepID=UPI001AEDDC7E